jgi:hypothetical protein
MTIRAIPMSQADSENLTQTGKVVGTIFGQEFLDRVGGITEGEVCRFDEAYQWTIADGNRRVKITRVQRVLQDEDGTINMISGNVVAIALDYELFV